MVKEWLGNRIILVLYNNTDRIFTDFLLLLSGFKFFYK